MSVEATFDCDIAIAGGGLAGSLIALVLAEKRPDLRVRLIEPAQRLGGNHVWSFFNTDIAPDHRWLIEPLICYSWQGYDVAFPAHSRTLDAVYNSIESERLDEVVRVKVNRDHIVEAGVLDIEALSECGFRVSLSNQAHLTARHVIDARGPGDLSTLDVGWQKFVGQALTIKGGHGLTRPIVKDATVDQIDGYRFVYCLPFDAETVFVEDTYYSDTSDLDVPLVRDRIGAYAAAKGWTIASRSREEVGMLPVVIGGDFESYWASSGDDLAKAGLRSGMFHATTGYSLPDAVRLAAALPDMIEDGADLAGVTRTIAEEHWKKRGFFRMLDTMLFRAAHPWERYRILERFYRLSPALIRRFYAGETTIADKVRILSGKPPIPIGRALRVLLEHR